MGLHFIGINFVGLHVTDLHADGNTFMSTCSLRISGPQFIILYVTDLHFIALHVKLSICIHACYRPCVISLHITCVHVVALILYDRILHFTVFHIVDLPC
jgi:hypothetical protein